MKNKTGRPIHIICHGSEVIHYVELSPGLTLDTGQASLETLVTKQDVIDRIVQLNPTEKDSTKLTHKISNNSGAAFQKDG